MFLQVEEKCLVRKTSHADTEITLRASCKFRDRFLKCKGVAKSNGETTEFGYVTPDMSEIRSFSPSILLPLAILNSILCRNLHDALTIGRFHPPPINFSSVN